MIRHALGKMVLVMALAAAWPLAAVPRAEAATGHEIRSASEETLTSLYNQNEVAHELGRKAKGILVFPKITKGGIGIGGSYGEGTLFVGGTAVAYYSIGSGSLGLTLGAQSFSQVIMFMTQQALDQFRASKGWEAGVDGSVVAIDEGKSKSYDTMKANDPVIGFTFGQQGLMFDASFNGAKYTRIRR